VADSPASNYVLSSDYFITRRVKSIRRDSEAAFMRTASQVRHQPPWQNRPWVMTDKGRQSRLGSTLECRRCNEGT
jgi:uncharacterized protein DUF3565